MIRALLAILLLAALPPAPVFAQPRSGQPATCARDLFQIEGGFRQQQGRLSSVADSDQAAQCRVWREHVTFLQKARALFVSCQQGAKREQNVAEMDGTLAEYRALLADRCKR